MKVWAPLVVVAIGGIAYQPQNLSYVLFMLVTLAAAVLGASAALGGMVLMSSKHTPEVKLPLEIDALHKKLQDMNDKPEKQPSHRPPVVFGRLVDSAIQQVMDLALRDYVSSWLNDLAFSEDELIQEMKDDIWIALCNLQERLNKIDQVKVVAGDIVTKITGHFERIRLAEAAAAMEGRDTLPTLPLSPHLFSNEREQEYIRRVSELLLVLLFPRRHLVSAPVKHLLREVLACAVMHPAIEMICDPDYINQKLLAYIRQQQATAALHKRTYAYAASFEEFVHMIRECNDVEMLTHLRYNIVTEIMQATTIHNLKKAKGLDPDKEIPQQGTGKGDMLQARNLKRYINQLMYAKSQCEKRLRVLGWQGYPSDRPSEQTTATRKVLPLVSVLDSIIGRRYLTRFLEQGGHQTLIGYWGAVEDLRAADRQNWHQLGAEIYYTYVHPNNSDIHVDKTVLKRMEAFLMGDKGHEVFFEVQEEVVKVLEKQHYPSFLVSPFYDQMQVAMEESVLEGNVELLGEPLSAGECNASADSATLHVVDHSNYARRKLDQLEERLHNKMQALQALRSSLKPDSRVLGVLEREVEWLEGEHRQLEAHLERTAAWGENLGRWRAVVQSADLPDDHESSPQFVLVVHLTEDDERAGAEGISTGWVVLRKLSDFQDLHRKLSQLVGFGKNVELPSQPGKFHFGKTSDKHSLERAKAQIQKYLDFVLDDERLNASEAVYAFLSPSPEHLKQPLPLVKKSRFSLSTFFKSSGGSEGGKDGSDEDELLLLDDGESGRMEGGRDAAAEPLYALLGEIFESQGLFRWMRKTLMTFVQVTYGRTINRQIRETVTWLFSEPMLQHYIQTFTKSWWPDGKLATPEPVRSSEEKLKTRLEAREQVLNNIPEFLTNLVGQQSARKGVVKAFETLQEVKLNKQLFYDIFEVLIYELCPELKK